MWALSSTWVHWVTVSACGVQASATAVESAAGDAGGCTALTVRPAMHARLGGGVRTGVPHVHVVPLQPVCSVYRSAYGAGV